MKRKEKNNMEALKEQYIKEVVPAMMKTAISPQPYAITTGKELSASTTRVAGVSLVPSIPL